MSPSEKRISILEEMASPDNLTVRTLALCEIARQLSLIAHEFEVHHRIKDKLVKLRIEREKLMIEKLDLHIAKAKRDLGAGKKP